MSLVPREARSLLSLAYVAARIRYARLVYSGSSEVCMASLRVSKTSFLVGTTSLALSTGASVSDMRGLYTYLQLSWTRLTMLVNVRVT